MKWMTVKEYAKFEGIKLSTAYKRIKEGQAKHEKKFGRLVVAVKEAA